MENDNTYRALCKIRIAYARHVIALELADLDAYWTEERAKHLEKTEKFWIKVQDYWKAKLNECKV